MTCQWALSFIPFVAIHARSLSVGSPSQTVARACPQAAICQWRLAHLRQSRVATGTGASARNPVLRLGGLASSPESSRGTRASVTRTVRLRLLKSAGEREKCAAAASAFERRRFPGLLDSESPPLWQPVAA